MRAVRLGRTVVRAFGWRGLLRRVLYLTELNTGRLERRTPQRKNVQAYEPLIWTHQFDLHRLRTTYAALPNNQDLRRAVGEGTERVLAGKLELYGWADLQVGWPPRWHVNPFTGHEYPRVHWTAISDNDPEVGDVKDVWEISRLPFTALLARAYVLTGDDRYPEAWWEALEDWIENNPPNTGVNWRCGQETSLRAITVCFGLSIFDEHRSTTPSRRDHAHRLLAASVARVELTLGYALSQRNNHAVSELVFLLSALGPQRHLCRLLLEVLDDQFQPDGSYRQQSFNYQRLAVQALQWLLVTREDLPPGLRSRVVDAVARSRDLLVRCSDPISGWLPNYGANDGALLFRLDSAHDRDFRPFLASLGRTDVRSAPSETAIWLGRAEVAQRCTDADRRVGTYVTLCGPRSLLVTRVGTSGERPGDADQLAVDLWIDGCNLVADPGSYRYTAPAPWANALKGLEVHATVRAASESVVRFGRFLSEVMPEADVVLRRPIDDGELLVAERVAGPGRLRRAFVRLGDAYVVVDHAVTVDAEVRWNLGQCRGARVRLGTNAAQRALTPREDDPTSGWVSPLYGMRRPCEVALVALPAEGVAVATFATDAVGWPSPDGVRAALDGVLPRAVVDIAIAQLAVHGSPGARGSDERERQPPRGR
jgi:hypothetical protein